MSNPTALSPAYRASAIEALASGGELADRGTNADWHADSPFVIEADESDGSFLVYHPHVAAITNVQPDHLDFYGTFDNVRAAYAAFAATVPPGGLVVACADDEGSNALAAQVSDRRVLTYGHALRPQRAQCLRGIPLRDGGSWRPPRRCRRGTCALCRRTTPIRGDR